MDGGCISVKKWKTRSQEGEEREREIEVFKTIKRRKSFGDSVAEHCSCAELAAPLFFPLTARHEIVRVLKTFNVIYLRTSS